MRILIYSDDGASPDSIGGLKSFFQQDEKKYKVCFVTGADLVQSNWMQSTDLLIIPGGRSLPFYEKLGKQGNKNIVDFVEQGGCYLGLCAGAYYACQETIFSKNTDLELLLPGELNFFKGNAIGPIYGGDDFVYGTEKGARVVDITWEDDKNYSVYLNGACYFENADQLDNTKVIARYASDDIDYPAVIQCDYGKGRVILSGIHPELCYRSIPEDDDAHHQAIRAKLLSVEQQRKNLLDLLLTSLTTL